MLLSIGHNQLLDLRKREYEKNLDGRVNEKYCNPVGNINQNERNVEADEGAAPTTHKKIFWNIKERN
jgi:hypothetical protein